MSLKINVLLLLGLLVPVVAKTQADSLPISTTFAANSKTVATWRKYNTVGPDQGLITCIYGTVYSDRIDIDSIGGPKTIDDGVVCDEPNAIGMWAYVNEKQGYNEKDAIANMNRMLQLFPWYHIMGLIYNVEQVRLGKKKLWIPRIWAAWKLVADSTRRT